MPPLAHPSERMETLNSVQIYFEIHGTGEPLLLLHGFSGSGQDWLPSAAAWGPHFQLILPDLRGHGRSKHLAKAISPSGCSDGHFRAARPAGNRRL